MGHQSFLMCGEDGPPGRLCNRKLWRRHNMLEMPVSHRYDKPVPYLATFLPSSYGSSVIIIARNKKLSQSQVQCAIHMEVLQRLKAYCDRINGNVRFYSLGSPLFLCIYSWSYYLLWRGCQRSWIYYIITITCPTSVADDVFSTFYGIT